MVVEQALVYVVLGTFRGMFLQPLDLFLCPLVCGLLLGDLLVKIQVPGFSRKNRGGHQRRGRFFQSIRQLLGLSGEGICPLILASGYIFYAELEPGEE